MVPRADRWFFCFLFFFLFLFIKGERAQVAEGSSPVLGSYGGCGSNQAADQPRTRTTTVYGPAASLNAPGLVWPPEQDGGRT